MRPILVILALVGLLSTAACDPKPCPGQTVIPGTDVTAALTSALATASATPISGPVGPSGAPVGRVYLGPGEYRFKSITVPDNVRIEIAPGATLRAVDGYEPNANNDWGLFVFGTDGDPTRNVTVTSGDGCGGLGTPTSANKPSNTTFRGNDPAVVRTSGGQQVLGMANAPVPFRPDWDTSAMWVMDLDPQLTNAGEQVTGFFFRWAYDVDVANVFTIQNASRTAAGIGPIDGDTSRTVAMMFDPPNDTDWTPVVEAQKIPHRIHVKNHYNILSPSGQGPNQIRACRDCTFESIFSHGGVSLRVETDGIRPESGTCAATGVNGEGFKEFAIVDGLQATRIEGAYGNRVAMFTPHCLPNGSATVNQVRGTSMGELVIIAARESDSLSGGFSAISITGVQGCGGALAQEPHPAQNSYLLKPSRAAVSIEPANPPIPVTLVGAWSWPAPPNSGGLPDGILPSAHGATITHPNNCT